jgi:large subunit ribosomal protein L18
MVGGPRYRIPFRRRKQGKTDYQARKALVLSKLPRLVVRDTLKNMIAQVVNAKATGDEVVVYAYSGELAKSFGWKADCGNLPAAYLTGILCGYRAIEKGVNEATLDIGLQAPSKGAKIFAVLKGALDAGLAIPHDDEILPNEARITGKHIVEYAKILVSNPEIYQKRFSKNLSRDFKPEQFTEHFSSVKEKIVSSFEKEKKKK